MAGRPKKTLDDLPPKWSEAVIEAYSEGASDVEIRAYALGNISDDLWYRLIEEEPEFSRTITRGRQLSEAWWARQGRVNLAEREFNANLYRLQMTNRFGWTTDATRNEHSGKDGKPIQHETKAEVSVSADAETLASAAALYETIMSATRRSEEDSGD